MAETRKDLGYDEEGYDPNYGYADPMKWKGPAISFRDWFLQQDDDMQNRVLKVFPSLKVEDWGP